MAKINTNLMNDIAESLKDSTKNLSSEEKKKVENEVLQEAQQKIENKQKQLEETASKTSEELNNYADKIEETEKNIVSSASDLDSVSEIPRMNDSTISNAVVERKSKQKIDDIILNATEDYNNQVKLAKENAHELEVTYNKYAGREINKRNQYIEDEYNINSKFKEEVDETIKETEEKLRKLEVTNNRYSNREINKRNQYIEDEYNINSKFKKDVDVTRERAIKVEQDKINKLQEKRIAEVNEWANEDERNKYELTLLHRLIYGNSESNKTILENAEIIANDNDGIKEEYYKEHGYVTGGDLAVGAISIVEGVGIFGENIIKAGDLVLSGLATGIGALDAVLGLTTDEDSWNNFKIWNKELWNKTASRISKDYVSSVFDSFYNNIGTGQDIKQSSEHFETARSFGVGVGYVGASLATAGTISGLAGIASGTTSASLVNAGIYGTARFGGATGDAVQNGASMDEALIYGYLTGLKEATGMFIGSQINQWNPFGTGTPIKTIANSFVHVACDTADGAVSAVIDPLMQSFYTPSEEMLLQLGYTEGVESYKNLSPWEKYKFNFEANGGWNTVWGTAKFSGIMSLASEIPTMAKEVIDYSKGTNLSKNITKNTIELDNAMKNGDEAMVESLNAKNLKLQESFNGLTDNQRYYYNLATLKNNIENGDINSNLINSFISSDNAEILFNNLSKEDKKLLANAMNGNQAKQFLNKAGDKTKNTFLKLFSSYPNSTNVEISNQPSVTSKIDIADDKIINIEDFKRKLPDDPKMLMEMYFNDDLTDSEKSILSKKIFNTFVQTDNLSEENVKTLQKIFEKNPYILGRFDQNKINGEIFEIGDLFVEKMLRYPDELAFVSQLQVQNPEKFKTFKILASELEQDNSLVIYNEKLSILLDFFKNNEDIANIDSSQAKRYFDYIVDRSHQTLTASDSWSSHPYGDRIILEHYSENYQKEFSEYLDDLYKKATTVEEKRNILTTKIFGLSTEESEDILKQYYINLSLEDIESARKYIGDESVDFLQNLYEVSKISDESIIDSLYYSSSRNSQDIVKVVTDLKKVYAKTYNEQLSKTAGIIKEEMAKCTITKSLEEFRLDELDKSCIVDVNGVKVPVIEAPDEFSFMVHSSRGRFSPIDKVSDRWNYAGIESNHIICCTYITKDNLGTYGTAQVYGFDGFSDEAILRMGKSDITSGGLDITSKSLFNDFVTADNLPSKTQGYNEIVLERTELRNGISNGHDYIQPTYIFVFDGMDAQNIENNIKIASEFNPPLQVVFIDKSKVAISVIDKVETNLDLFETTHNLDYLEKSINAEDNLNYNSSYSDRTQYHHSRRYNLVSNYLDYIKTTYESIPESKDLCIKELQRFRGILFDSIYGDESSLSVNDMIQYIKVEN